MGVRSRSELGVISEGHGSRLRREPVLLARALVEDEHLGVAVRDELGDLCCEQGGGITLIEVVAFF